MTDLIFAERGLSQIPRILGFMDRDPASLTYGCADRMYWHYKTIDFANARFQEASLVLALAYVFPFSGNKYFQKHLLKEWSLAAVDFWARKRHGDGSTDESYPYERHFCSTAFSLYAVTETLLVLSEKPRWDLSPTGKFLACHDNLDVSNQTACAALALHNLFLCLGEKKWQEASEEKLEKLLKLQSNDGGFQEYGGFDLGYDSITLSFLARLYLNTKREDIKAAALRLIQKAQKFINEDGYYSGEEMSRRAQFLYPYGFLVFAPSVLEKLANGLRKDVVLNPAWMDDRYTIPLTANYLLTAA